MISFRLEPPLLEFGAPIHVAHVVESFAAGCLSVLATLCHMVQGNIHHSVIYSLRQETPANFQDLFPQGVDFYRLPMSRAINPVRDAAALWRLRALLRDLHPHLVHCHSSKAGFLGRWAARCVGLPSVYTPHGYAFLRTDVRPVDRWLFKTAEWLAARAGNGVAACGEEEWKLSRSFTGSRDYLLCIPNCVSLEEVEGLRQSARPALSLPDRVVVGTCGRPDPQRNPVLFGELALALRKEAAWIWIGAGSDSPAPLPEHVLRPGWLGRGEALASLGALDIYIQTSLWEGLSCALLEAMALGKPVVATDITANRAVVEHGVTGFLGSSREELQAHLCRLVEDAPLRCKMGAAARDWVLTHHNAHKGYQTYDRLYHSLAGARA